MCFIHWERAVGECPVMGRRERGEEGGREGGWEAVSSHAISFPRLSVSLSLSPMYLPIFKDCRIRQGRYARRVDASVDAGLLGEGGRGGGEGRVRMG